MRALFILSWCCCCVVQMLLLPLHAFTPPPGGSFFRSSATAGPQQHTSSFSRPSSADSGSGSGDFSFNDLERELSRRRQAEERETGGPAASSRPPPAADAAGAVHSRGLEEGEAFMEEQMVLRKKLFKAYVVVFNQGEPEEGVYTLFVQGRNVLRAWQDKPEAARYALMLRAEDLPLGRPTELPMSQIIEFCKDNGVGLEIVPRGRGLHPPSRNKPQIDFDYSKSSSQGQDCGSARGSSSAAAGTGRQRRDESSLFTPQELARIKKQFEKSLEGSGEEE
ncbi:unnamed protein product [Ectocarpus sp. 12 AP-2014]